MRWQVFLFFLFFLGFNISPALAQTIKPENLTLALIFEDTESQYLSPNLIKALEKEGFSIQEKSLTETISKNLKFPNQMNLTLNEARNFGQALGVDAFLIVRTILAERADVGASLYGDCYLAIAFVSTKSGKLSLFDFIEIKQPSTKEAFETATKKLISQIPSYTTQFLSSLNNQLLPPKLDSIDIEALEIPVEGSELSERFKLPKFSSRKQPIYTENARKMMVSAIVELEVVLRKDGTVGNIEITHWAGFGLDESAIAAAKELKFSPATLDERAVSCRAVLRYNFNYKTQAATPKKSS